MLIQGDINYFFLFSFSTKATSFKLTNVAHLILSKYTQQEERQA